MIHRSIAQLEAGLDHIRRAPSDDGVLALIARRPGVDLREVLDEARLDLEQGLVGDTWRARAGSAGAHPHPDRQLTVMNARAIAIIAGQQERWALAGDQLYVDLDLSKTNVPPGTRLAIGGAVIEVSEPPHTGCSKFSGRFGLEALQFVNSSVGRELCLRGINARVVQPGIIRRGDQVRKQPAFVVAVHPI